MPLRYREMRYHYLRHPFHLVAGDFGPGAEVRGVARDDAGIPIGCLGTTARVFGLGRGLESSVEEEDAPVLRVQRSYPYAECGLALHYRPPVCIPSPLRCGVDASDAQAGSLAG